MRRGEKSRGVSRRKGKKTGQRRNFDTADFEKLDDGCRLSSERSILENKRMEGNADRAQSL